MNRCPQCDSPAPHLHPAVQYEGEVSTCTDEFHLTPTPSNRPEYIDNVTVARAAAASRTGGTE